MILNMKIRHKPEGRGFETKLAEWFLSVCLILLAALGPGDYSAPNRNEYQRHKWKNGSGSTARPVREVDNPDAICEPTVYKMWDPQHLTTL
jgi:hypothetical protein